MVHLSITQKITYYLFPVLMLALGCIPLYYSVMGDSNRHLTLEIAIVSMIILWLLSFLSYIKQKNGLRFYSISTDRTVKLNMQITRNILREHKWQITQSTSNFIQVQGYGFREGVDLRSWGELMTIEIKSTEIRVNSICDPDSMFAQFASFGKNKQNIRDFEMLYLQKSNNYVDE